MVWITCPSIVWVWYSPEASRDPVANPVVSPEASRDPAANPVASPEVSKDPVANPVASPEASRDPVANPFDSSVTVPVWKTPAFSKLVRSPEPLRAAEPPRRLTWAVMVVVSPSWEVWVVTLFSSISS